MGLGENNYAAKRRLLAQFDYINQGLAYESLELTEEDLARHFEQHSERFAVPAQITFTHVFLRDEPGSEEHDEEAALKAAHAELRWLDDNALPFHESASRGDHFLYHRSYAGRSPGEIAAHFGPAFADELFALGEGLHWQGPIRSVHGMHLVQVAASQPARLPDLQAVHGRVAADLERERVQAAQEDFYQRARANYRVSVPESAATQSATTR